MTIKKGFQCRVLWYLTMSLILNNWNTQSAHKDSIQQCQYSDEELILQDYVKTGMPSRFKFLMTNWLKCQYN